MNRVKSNDLFQENFFSKLLFIISWILIFIAIFLFITLHWKLGILTIFFWFVIAYSAYLIAGGRRNPWIYQNNRKDSIRKGSSLLLDEDSVLMLAKPKEWKTALLISIFLGYLGIDRFYLGYIYEGFLKLITAGGYGIWWIIDIIRITKNSLPDARGIKLSKKNK